MAIKTLEELIEYCKANDRICPQPQLWNLMWDKLKDKQRVGSSGWEPPLPLILAAWWDASPSSKQFRLVQHLTWAANHDQLIEIANFLTSLREDQWFHLND